MDIILSELDAITKALQVGSLYKFTQQICENKQPEIQLIYKLSDEEEKYYDCNSDSQQIFRLITNMQQVTKINLEKSINRILNVVQINIDEQLLSIMQKFTKNKIVKMPRSALDLSVMQRLRFSHILITYLNYLFKYTEMQQEKQNLDLNNQLQSNSFQPSFYEESYTDSHIFDSMNDSAMNYKSIEEKEENIENFQTKNADRSQKQSYAQFNDLLQILHQNCDNVSEITDFNNIVEPIFMLYNKLKYRTINPFKINFTDCTECLRIKHLVYKMLIGYTVSKQEEDLIETAIFQLEPSDLSQFKNYTFQNQLSEKSQTNPKGSYMCDSQLSMEEEPIFYNQSKQLLRLVDMVEFFIKNTQINSYIGVHAIWFVYLAFLNINSLEQFINLYLKRKPVINGEEANLIVNYLLHGKLSASTLWINDQFDQYKNLTPNTKYLVYNQQIEKAFQQVIALHEERQKQGRSIFKNRVFGFLD